MARKDGVENVGVAMEHERARARIAMIIERERERKCAFCRVCIICKQDCGWREKILVVAETVEMSGKGSEREGSTRKFSET